MKNGLNNMLNSFLKSVTSSKSNVSQICIGNGNIQCRGNVVSEKIIINGREIDLDDDEWLAKEGIRVSKDNIKIEITGDVDKVDIPMGDVTIKGNVTGSVKTSQGDIEIGGDVEGDISTSMGNITIKGKHSGGNVRSSMGNVNINS